MLPASPSGTIKQFVDEFAYIKDLELDPKAYYTGTLPVREINPKVYEIWDYYKENKTLVPNNILKRHKM